MKRICAVLFFIIAQLVLLTACNNDLNHETDNTVGIGAVVDFILIFNREIDGIYVTFHIKNAYGEPIKLYKTNAGIMDMPYPEQFELHCSVGGPAYLGPLRSTNESDREELILAPMEGIAVTFNLSDYYDFSECEGMLYGQYKGLAGMAGINFDNFFVADSDTAYYIFPKRQEHKIPDFSSEKH